MSKKINVLISYHGKKGSGPSYSLEWAKGLMQYGCNVCAVVSKEVVNLKEWQKIIPNNQLYLIDTHHDYNKFSLIIKTIKLLCFGRREIKKKFKGIEFDFSFHTFYCHWANLVDQWVDVKKVIAICHDPIAHLGTQFYMQYLLFRHYKKADEIFTLTRSFKETVHKQFGTPLEHIHYIPHGRMQMYNEYSNEMLNSLKYNKEYYNFLFFGFVERYKGLNILAKAYEIVSNQRNDVTLTIAGNGDFTCYKDDFSNLKNVQIINRYIKDEEVGALFVGQNVAVILPYITATQSGVIPIAYEFLTPVIASNTGGLKEQLDDGRIGIMFSNGDIEDLANKMLTLINDKTEWERQKALMLEYRNNLNWSKLAEELIRSII